MSYKRHASWEDKWRKIDGGFKSGSQGSTFVVNPVEALDTNDCYILKVLNRQNDLERRKRMYREMASLRTLSHTGIPALVDSNAEQFDKLDEQLYIVMQYIQGPTLEDYVQTGNISFDSARTIVTQLCNILEYAHENDVRHRDIKPSNIVLRKADPHDPVLLDFGLSFNERLNIYQEQLTDAGQQLGNRFLALPEFQIYSSAKHDPRSDITQTVGILFYLLTGLQPYTLIDHMGYKPHQRTAAQDIFTALPSDVLDRLTILFDQAFEVHIDKRIQSASGLRILLNDYTSKSETAIDRIMAINLAIQSSNGYKEREEILQLFFAVNENTRNAWENIYELLGPSWATIQTDFEMDIQNLAWRNSLGVYPETHPEFKFFAHLEASINGEELVVTATDGTHISRELLRAVLNGPKDWNLLQRNLMEYYLEGLSVNTIRG